MIAAMHQDIGLLGIEPPSVEPRATEYVPQMLSLIGQLEGKGLAYRASNGDVNYSVRKFDGYGKLSGKSLDELRAKLIAMVQTPATRIAGVVAAPAAQLARVFGAYAKKDEAA